MKKQAELVAFIASKIATSVKTQREIAREAGFRNPDFISMIASGTAKIPMNRIPALADALEIHRVELLYRCLDAYHPEFAAILASLIPDMPTTEDEIALLRGYKILKEHGVVGTDGVEIRSLQRKGAWARVAPGGH